MGWLSDLFKNEQTSQLQGWEPAMGGLNAAMGLGEQALANPWETYGGELVAGLNQNQNAALGGMANFGQGMGGSIANQFAQGGSGAYNAGLGGYGGVLGSLGQGLPQVGQLDQGYAQSIASNPYVDSQITASLRDPYRGLTEQTLPGIDAAGAMGGNVDSSRSGIAEGLARRGYEDRASDVGAAFRGQAYGQGLGIANQQATMNPGLQLQGMNTALGAAGGLAGMGQYGLNQGYNLGAQNIGMQLGAGNIQQQQQQRVDDAAQQQFYLGQQLPMQQAQQGINMFQPLAQNFGETTQTQTTGLGNAGAQIAGQVIGAYVTGGASLLGGGGGGQAPPPINSAYMPTSQQYFGGGQQGYNPYGAYNPYIGGGVPQPPGG